MPPIPREFEDLLSARGRRILAGRDPAVGALLDPERGLLGLDDAIDRRKAESLRRALEQRLLGELERMDAPIPPATITGMRRNYSERLPKIGRMSTAYLDDRRHRSYRVAQEMGLLELLRSQSFRAFSEAISGRRLRRRWGTQVLCYSPGDYAGPHNDHHPEEPEARDGYLDVHLTLASADVAHQWLVYSRGAHLSRIRSANTLGRITAYRLPLWHYTTPLVAKPGREATARRWVLLGTFLFAKGRGAGALQGR